MNWEQRLQEVWTQLPWVTQEAVGTNGIANETKGKICTSLADEPNTCDIPRERQEELAWRGEDYFPDENDK